MQHNSKKEEFSIQSVHFLQNFFCGVFPCHPASLAPAGVYISEKHNALGPAQPFAERFCVVLVTTKIYSGEGIHKKKNFCGEGVT